MIFTWKESRTYSVDPQRIGDELEKIRAASNGALVPSAVVKCASNRKNVLHPLFEWDDRQAATAFRKHQARMIIRGLVIHMDSEEDLPPTGYVNVVIETDEGSEQYYTTAIDAVNNDVTRIYILAQALRSANYFRTKYRHLEELSAIINQMDIILDEV